MWAGNILCCSINPMGEGMLVPFSCWYFTTRFYLTQALQWETGRKLPVLTMMLLFKIAVNSRANGNQFKCDSWFAKERKDSGPSAMLKAFLPKERLFGTGDFVSLKVGMRSLVRGTVSNQGEFWEKVFLRVTVITCPACVCIYNIHTHRWEKGSLNAALESGRL